MDWKLYITMKCALKREECRCCQQFYSAFPLIYFLRGELGMQRLSQKRCLFITNVISFILPVRRVLFIYIAYYLFRFCGMCVCERMVEFRDSPDIAVLLFQWYLKTDHMKGFFCTPSISLLVTALIVCIKVRIDSFLKNNCIGKRCQRIVLCVLKLKHSLCFASNKVSYKRLNSNLQHKALSQKNI